MLIEEYIRANLSYDAETGLVKWLIRPSKKIRAGEVAGGKNGQGYVEIKVMGRCIQAHRVGWLLTYGEWPEGCIDHINRIRDDNRIENLRLASKAQNSMNRTALSNNQHGVKGCYFVPQIGKWRAQCRVDKKLFHLGYFVDIEEAKQAYNRFAQKHFGAFFVPA